MKSSSIRGQVDPKSAEILLAIQYFGEATTNEIRQRTGLNPSETQYRRNKLKELGLIELRTTETHFGEQYLWSLTGTARRELERGLGEASNLLIYDDPESHEISTQEFREMQNELERLREAQKASASDDSMRDGVDREEFEEFEEYIYEWHNATEQYIRALREVVERYVPEIDNLADHVEEMDER